jgi:hypothetical protein
MSTASTAAALQHLLEAEGAVIHAALQARALPSMGGGVGMVLSTALPPGSTLARFPFRSMITARKARFNLAMAEVALELQEGKVAKTPGPTRTAVSATVEQEEEDLFPVIPFTSRVWSENEFELKIRSQEVRRAIDAKVEELEAALDSTETIVCYILLMAALHGRWQADGAALRVSDGRGDEGSQHAGVGGADASTTPSPHPALLRYTHENRWMRTWIHALPVQYDNLLELAPQQGDPPDKLGAASPSYPLFSTSPSSPVLPLPLGAAYTTSPAWLCSYVSLARFRATALLEQDSIAQRYRKCCAALRSLRWMPGGVEIDQPPPTHVASAEANNGDVHLHQPRSPSPVHTRHPEELCGQHRSSPCTLGHYLWAFNTLMSRGFFFPEETWALMPFVDYFNYALDSNGTMFPQEDDPDDAESLSSASLSMVHSIAMSAAAPRKQARRTGLRSARVGRDAIPLVNYSTYEFQLIRPVRAAGEQVMLHYGAYSDMELLMWYGFTLRPSLLPTGHFSSVVEETTGDEANGAISLLPPGMASTAGGDSLLLLQTARALRVILPQIMRATTRVAYYRRHIQHPCVSTDTEERTPNVGRESRATRIEGENCEGDYNEWAKALHRAYRLPLSPLADAEGNYPPAVRGQTWMDALFASFLQTPPVAAPSTSTGAGVDSCAAAARVDGWMRQWIAQRWPLFAETAFPRVAKGCALAVFGLSPDLQAAVTSSFWVGPNREEMGTAEQKGLVRGIAWAELYVNACMETPAQKGMATPSNGVPVSAAAAALARIASVDQWALLQFLSLESSDAALEEYLTYESESN